MNLLSKTKTGNRGFTMIEVVAVLVIIGILAAVAFSRTVNYDTEVYTGADVLKSHLRYAQTMAMNSNPNSSDQLSTIFGINCANSAYWLFKGTDTATAKWLPEEEKFINNDKINLKAKKIKVSDFTIYFDNRGIPYTSYTDITTNTPLSDTNTLTINVQPLNSATPNTEVTITPLTGYIR